uniref:Plastid light harvesting protein n=1 Tax=Fibrocapsa japonica TaxID=94617 RepID=A0A7S2USL5_9STRA|mmetsp:Transcript_11305/g.16676  ORF Transcript_11305/g.16676 Transcript_11305/m.16676 type:complete len:205 (+) Transcript_11305:158-772(+)
MMKSVAALALVGAATAFMPAAPLNSVQGTSAKAVAPLAMSAEPAWDPMGFSKLSAVSNNNPDYKWLQESELKHGRICMLAFVGVCMTHAGVHLDAYPATSDWTAAFSLALQNNPAGMAQIFLAIGTIEGFTYPGELWFGKGREPGDLGYDPLSLKKNWEKNPGSEADMRLKELNNGRAAMIAMAAFASHALLPGSVPFYDLIKW